MAKVVLDNVYKSYGSTEAVKGISLVIEDGELIVILGPSGCGKTSTIRMIAGLEKVTAGDIVIAGQVVNDVPPFLRNAAMAFENYGLYERWTVYENIEYPLKLRGVPVTESHKLVLNIARRFKLMENLYDLPDGLSGGMRQRIGLARALVRDPSIFLLDEPMSHIDTDSRNDMRAEIKKIHQSTGSTMIIVTHDQMDALSMADRVLVMNNGIIEQIDTPEVIYNFPINSFVAEFIGEPPMNVVDTVISENYRGVLIDRENFSTSHLVARFPGLLKLQAFKIGFRPHKGQVVKNLEDRNGEDSLSLSGEIYMIESLGGWELITVRVSDVLVKIQTDVKSDFELKEKVLIKVNFDDIHFFDAETLLRLEHKSLSELN
jgi:multiple sugar transport system ATP-binding protein